MGKTIYQESDLLAWLEDALRRRLGRGWSVGWKSRRRVAEGGGAPDAVVTIKAPDGTAAAIRVQAKARVTPSSVAATAAFGRLPVERDGVTCALLVAPYIGPRVREQCRRRRVAYADQTGAWSLRVKRPSIDWEVEGASKNPEPERRGLTSLQGSSTARVLRALVDYRPPFTLSELAKTARVTAATAYKVLVLLEGEGVVEREPRGAVVTVDWRGLLNRWARDYRLKRQGVEKRYLAARGVQRALDELRTRREGRGSPDLRWALTGAWAARDEFDTLAGARAVIYTNQPTRLAESIGLSPAQGPVSNVTLLAPRDPSLFEESVDRGGLWCAPWSQIAIDLLGGADREPSAGENLLAWMDVNEDRWRSMWRSGG